MLPANEAHSPYRAMTKKFSFQNMNSYGLYIRVVVERDGATRKDRRKGMEEKKKQRINLSFSRDILFNWYE